ncbi:hypothetical protein LTS10_012044 [Elasticomyces elasticus]|nr:hypothetical protein LTS10_012044 [Elasticomyces elasticus]
MQLDTPARGITYGRAKATEFLKQPTPSERTTQHAPSAIRSGLQYSRNRTAHMRPASSLIQHACNQAQRAGKEHRPQEEDGGGQPRTANTLRADDPTKPSMSKSGLPNSARSKDSHSGHLLKLSVSLDSGFWAAHNPRSLGSQQRTPQRALSAAKVFSKALSTNSGQPNSLGAELAKQARQWPNPTSAKTKLAHVRTKCIAAALWHYGVGALSSTVVSGRRRSGQT